METRRIKGATEAAEEKKAVVKRWFFYTAKSFVSKSRMELRFCGRQNKRWKTDKNADDHRRVHKRMFKHTYSETDKSTGSALQTFRVIYYKRSPGQYTLG